MSKCGKCSGKSGTSKYSGGSAPRNAYAIPGASLYGFGGFAMPRGYAGDPIGRYMVLYSRKSELNRYMPVERYKHPKLKGAAKPLVPFTPFTYESDTFHGMERFDSDTQLSLHDPQTRRRSELPFTRPPYLVDEEEKKRRYHIMR
ncbi:MAG: hypothetical protein WC613_06375 [Candidatus Aenigmatarchaeota archaeon]